MYIENIRNSQESYWTKYPVSFFDDWMKSSVPTYFQICYDLKRKGAENKENKSHIMAVDEK